MGDRGSFVASFPVWGRAFCLFSGAKFRKEVRMMKNMQKTAALALALALILSLAACGAQQSGGLWDSATYTDDTELGEGATTLTVEVTAEEKTVTFTIHTDGATLREALEEHGLIAGDESEFGLYVKTVNGMTADYDNDGLYWALYKAGEYLMTGVDTTEIADGEQYELVCTKG